MFPFEYINVRELTALPDYLEKDGEKSAILAGGTDLLGLMKEGLLKPRKVVNIKQIRELRGIRDTRKGLEIGAATRLSEIEQHPIIQQQYPVLAQAVASIATPQLRNMGTIGGNLCQRPRCWYFRGQEYHCLKKGGDMCYAVDGLNKYHAILGGGPCYIVHPSDAAPALIALGATVEIFGPQGKRTVPLEEFFQLPEDNLLRENILAPNEVVTRIFVPRPEAETRSLYLKFRERQSMDFAITSVAALVQLRNGKVQKARLVLGGVAPIPWRAREAEKILEGNSLSADRIQQAAEAALKEADPLDQNAYKVILARNLIRKAFTQLQNA
ncbi:MAG: xanthine dehydrogenase family protein subunit M [Calditrichaeota bacterium]|nr:xanthine dehydrogenase family protein subunit M [Calditrichota bacterium]